MQNQSMTSFALADFQVTEAVNEKKEVEAAEHTFQPKINERSKAIFRPKFGVARLAIRAEI